MQLTPRPVRISFCLLALLVLASAPGCATISRTPRNLALVKKELREYAKADYPKQIEAVAADASEWIRTRASRARPGERLAIVMDLDETLLSNERYFEQIDYGYSSDSWHAWNLKGEAPAFSSICDLFHFARRSNVEVVFITGRREKTRHGAEANLKGIGCSDYFRLICRPDGDTGSVIPFKSGARAGLEPALTIIANIGDQKSDLTGGHAEKTFLLPNPFYLVP